MTRTRAFRLVLPAFILCIPVPAGAQTPLISVVEIKGSSDPTLARYLAVKVGEAKDPEAVRASVLLLSATDLFDDVSVEEESAADGSVHLIFKVAETPRLGELRFVTRSVETGQDVPLDSGLAKALGRASGLRPAETFREKSLIDAATRMTDWLRAHAYPRATVEMEPLVDETELRADGFVRDVRVRVLQALQETLASSRIEGWPAALPAPKSPAHPGAALTTETLDAWKDSLLDILRKNAYYRAQAKTESVAGDLVFFVTPGPPYDVKLDLLDEKAKAKARARFDKEGLSQDAIEETTSLIESDFVRRGYRDVDVDFQDVRTGERGLAAFVVRPGPLWMVTSVEYQTDGVVTPPRSGGLKVGVPWLDADIEAEKTRLRAELLQQGHASALVSDEESGDPLTAKVTFKIVPSTLTTVASVVLEGAPALENRSRESATELITRESSPFRIADVARDRTALLASLRDDGYVDARVEATTAFSDDRTTVAVTFHLSPGPRVRVGRVLVVGLRHTRETVVRRESRLKEGDFLSYQKLLDTQAGLSATGLFSNVQIRELADEGDARSLIIEVTEGPRITIVPGLGTSQTERVRGSVEFTKLNLSGLGRTASLFLRGAISGSSRALLSLTEPYAFGRRQAVNVQFFADDDRSRLPAFEFHRLGFQTQTIFPHRYGTILVQYTLQKTTTTNVATDCAEVNRDLCDARISGPSVGFVHDTRSDALDPRRGTLYSLENLMSFSSLGGDSFLRSSAFIARYEELRAGFVLAGSARLGLSRAFGPSTELPLPERFFAGGPSLMRGFKVDEVGPGHRNANNVFIPTGGNALLAAALEARVDVTKRWGFQIFAETGNVFSSVSSIRLGELREVAGVGLRYRSPFGPLRLDLGFKLDKRPDESRQQLHIGVGYAF